MYSVATACFWFMPMSMSLWWVWLRSAFMGFCPLRMRRRKAEVVSKMGKPRMMKGTTKEMTAYSLKSPVTDTVASMKPRNVAPVSPMNILAGLRL